MVDAGADDAVRERAGFGVRQLKFPGMDRNMDRSVGERTARKLPSAGQAYGRPGCTQRCNTRKHVGAGQCGDHGAGRIAQQLSRWRELHEAPVVDDADSRGERDGVLKRMRDHQRRQAEFSQHVGEIVTHLLACDRVESRERLVQQQHPGLASKRSRERDALALAAGQVSRMRASEVRDPNALQQVGAVALTGEADVSGDREMREQPVVLRQVPDAPSLRAEVDAQDGIEPDLTTKRDTSTLWALEPGDGSQQRGLTRPGRPDDGDRLGAEAQRRANVERSPCEDDVDVEEVHE